MGDPRLQWAFESLKVFENGQDVYETLIWKYPDHQIPDSIKSEKDPHVHPSFL